MAQSGKYLEQTFLLVDLVTFSYFFMDFFFRLVLCPARLTFIKNFLNIIDICSILIFFILVVMILSHHDTDTLYFMRRIIESTRVILFLNITKLSWRFQTVCKTLKKSVMELLLAIFYILVSMLVLSTLMFYSEVNLNSGFDSIPSAFWWAIMTMTTVNMPYIIQILDTRITEICQLWYYWYIEVFQKQL